LEIENDFPKTEEKGKLSNKKEEIKENNEKIIVNEDLKSKVNNEEEKINKDEIPKSKNIDNNYDEKDHSITIIEQRDIEGDKEIKLNIKEENVPRLNITDSENKEGEILKLPRL